MAEERSMITMEARVNDPAAHGILLKLLDYDGHLRRRLFVDFHILGIDPNELKRRYTEQITARHFNSLLYSVKTLISSLEELKKEHLKTKLGKIRSAEKWLKDKEARLKKVAADIRALTTFKAAKQAAKKADKRLKIPARLRGLSLSRLTAERALLRMNIHHKKRYLESAKLRLEKLAAQDRVSVCFGSKKLFQKQFHLEENDYQSHEDWSADFAFARSASTVFIGSKDESAGNQTAQYDLATATLALRLPKTPEFVGMPMDRLIVSNVHFPEKYLPHLIRALGEPQAGGSASSKVHSAVQVRIVKRKKSGGQETALYIQITCQPIAVPLVTDLSRGAIGVDLNANHLAVAETDRFGNLIRVESLPFALRGLSANQAEAILGDYVAAVVAMAKQAGKPLAIEKLDFRSKKTTLREQSPGYAYMLSSLVYAKFHDLIRSRSAAEGVGLYAQNPAYSSVIGLQKFYGLDITSHEKAALVLARRALGYSERPKVFHGTRKSPARMTSVAKRAASVKRPGGKSKRCERHVWSFWARQAKTIRRIFVRGTKRRPRVSVEFGECYHKHPQVAKAAGVMSLAETRGRQEHPPTAAQGRGDAARPTTERQPISRQADQVCVGYRSGRRARRIG